MSEDVGDDAESKAVGILWEGLVNFDHPEELSELLQECADQNREWGSSASQNAKNSLKKTLLVNQKGQCAYCRRRIKDELGHVEIDHILPKSAKGDIVKSTSNIEADRFCTQGYPQFSFEKKNLILTCKRCNNKKGSYDSRRNRSIVAGATYALNADYYSWVHPYTDQYSEHISLHKGLIYTPLNGSTKGDTLIRICKLDSIAAVEALARNLTAMSADGYTKAIMKLLGNVDEIGWEGLTDSIIQAFPEINPAIIEIKVDEFKKASGD
jgi:5-methylcytosine-specific restriction endonuclease McrA